MLTTTQSRLLDRIEHMALLLSPAVTAPDTDDHVSQATADKMTLWWALTNLTETEDN